MLVPDQGGTSNDSVRLLPIVSKKIVESRIVPVLLDAIFNENADTDFRESVLGLVKNLSLNPDAKKSIGHSSAALIAAMRNCSEAEVKLLACYALTHLAIGSSENQARISGEGGLYAVLAAIRSHPGNAEMLTAAYGLMTELAIDNEDIASKFVGEGGTDLLLSTMKEHSDNVNVQIAVCGVLAYLPYGKRERAAPKLAKAIIYALDRHPENAEVQTAACEALLEIATHVPAVRSIVKEKKTQKLLLNAKERYEACASDVDDILAI